MRAGFATDPLFLRHDTGPDHPERADRLRSIQAAVEDLDLVRIGARDASVEEIEAAHGAGYPEVIRKAVDDGARHLDADTAVCADSYAAAVRAAGTALAIGEAWLDGRIDTGFAAVRPPGHHACRARPMGFCLFNNVAVLARFLQSRGKSVAIVDWDVHHGNGTQDIFFGDAATGYCSLHQFPFYPGTGAAEETGAGNVLNVPLAAGCGGTEYRDAFSEKVLPWLDERAPDIVLVSAGFDAHVRDPLAQMRLEAGDFAWFTEQLLGRPMLSLLEGGYDLEGLSSSVRAHLEVLISAG